MKWGTLLRRDLAQLLGGGASGGVVLPILFFLAVAVLIGFAVGPDPKLLSQIGGGVIWVAALLAAILPLERLIAPDMEQGVFDQLALRRISEEASVAIKLLAHWLSFAPILLLATLPASLLLNLDNETTRIVMIGLLAGTPGLAAIGVMIAGLTASLKSGAALAGLLFIPLAIPILIFGAGALAQPDGNGLALCAAISLILVAITPFAAGAAIRAAREG